MKLCREFSDYLDPLLIPEGVWSSEDMAELVKLATIKFPPGMGARWQHISKAMGRSVEDVTSAAKRIKHFQASVRCHHT